MIKIQEILEDYLSSDEMKEGLPFLNEAICLEVPIKPERKNEWEIVTDPKRLMRTYEFENSSTLHNFINEVFQYQESVSHHGKFTIDYRKVIVEVYTHDIDDVTELDLEWAKMADQIYEDVKNYGEEFRFGY